MRGVFWVVEGELKAYLFEDGAQVGVAKSGKTFNHKLLWEHVRSAKCNRAFDYYPRGRVDYNGKGKPVIYMNPHVGQEYVAQIVKAFGLTEEPVVKYDGSEHYKCYLDR